MNNFILRYFSAADLIYPFLVKVFFVFQIILELFSKQILLSLKLKQKTISISYLRFGWDLFLIHLLLLDIFKFCLSLLLNFFDFFFHSLFKFIFVLNILNLIHFIKLLILLIYSLLDTFFELSFLNSFYQIFLLL